MARAIIPHVVNGQEIYDLAKTASVKEAAKLMAEKRIAAVMITENDQLIGIVTERDLTMRVIAKGADPEKTTLAEIMTADPDTLRPNDRPSVALELMRSRGYRHLPVVDDGKPVGIVSIRDLYDAVHERLERDVRDRDAFIFGETYGTGT